MSIHKITLTINGKTEMVEVPSHITLLTMLREKLALTGTKSGCEAGECGACTVLMNGEPVNSCMVLAVECDGAQITTVEGLAEDNKLSILQQSFADHNAVQCGFARRACSSQPMPCLHATLILQRKKLKKRC